MAYLNQYTPILAYGESYSVNIKTGWRSVQDSAYGAIADAVTITDGILTSGSYTLSSNSSNFTSDLIGKSLVATGAGSVNGYIASVTQATNTTPISATFTLNQVASYSLVSSKIVLSGNTNTAANGTFYLGNITSYGSNIYGCKLYTDQQLLSGAASNGTSGGGGVGYFPSNLVTTITNVGVKTLTLANSAVASLTAICTYGTDNTTAIQRCINNSTVSSPSAYGVVFLPAGNYLTTTNLNIFSSNFTIRGEGIGVSNIIAGNDIASILTCTASISSINNVTIRDLTLNYPGRAQQRYVTGNGIRIGTGDVNRINNVKIQNVEVYNTSGGIQFNSNVSNSTVTNCNVRDCLGDGIAVYSVTAPCSAIIVTNNLVVNSGDDSYSNNSYTSALSTVVSRDVTFANNISINSAAAGIATVGSDGCTIVGNTIRRPYLAGIRAQAGGGFNSVSNLLITNNQIFGTGLGSLPTTSSTVGPAGGITVTKYDTSNYAMSSIVIDNNIISSDPTGTSYGNGILVYDYQGNSNVFTNVKLTNNTIVGPFSTNVGYRQQPLNLTTLDGIYLNNFNNAIVTNNYIFKPRNNGIATGTKTNGIFIIRENIVDTPNTTASLSSYGYLLLGSAAVTYGDNSVVNTSTLAGTVSSTLQLYTYVNNLSVQGNIISNTNYTATAYLSATTTAPTNSDLWLPLSVRNDPNNWILNTGIYPALSGKITPTVPGYYMVNYQVAWNGTTGTGQNNIQIRQNGTNTRSIAQMPLFTGSGGAQTQTTSAIVYLNGVSDSLNFSAYSSGTGQTIVGETAGQWTKVEIFKIN